MLLEKLADSVKHKSMQKLALAMPGTYGLAKHGSYTPGSMSEAIEDSESSKELQAAIDRKIKEYRKSGRLVDKSWWPFDNTIGPNTAPKGSSALALVAKAINTIRPDTIDYKLTPSVNMSGYTGKELIEGLSNNSAKYMRKLSPDIEEKVYDAVAAHEILEAEAMEKNIDGVTNVKGGLTIGGLLGGAAGLAGIYALGKHGKNLSDNAGQLAMEMSLLAPVIGGGLGAGLASVYNKLRGIPGMEDRWSSHMSADIPRLESVMINKLNDPALTEIFKALRNRTGERRTFQDVAMQDYSENIPKERLSDLQRIDPNKYYLG